MAASRRSVSIRLFSSALFGSACASCSAYLSAPAKSPASRLKRSKMLMPSARKSFSTARALCNLSDVETIVTDADA